MQSFKSHNSRVAALCMAVMMLFSLMPSAVLANGGDVDVPSADTAFSAANVGGVSPAGINYDANDVIVPAKFFTYGMSAGPGDVPAGAMDTTDNSINLTRETIDLYNPRFAAFSVNGGKTWNRAESFTEAAFVKLLNKDLELWICNTMYDTKTKKPNEQAPIVAFSPIKKRAPRPALVVNYELGACNYGGVGEFVLTKKNSNVSVKEEIEIGRADAAANNKKVDSAYFGKFFENDGTTNGIPLTEMTEAGKVTKALYFIRTAPVENTDGTFTAASTPKRIAVKGLTKPTKRKVNYNTEVVKLSRGDAYAIGESEFEIVTQKSYLLDISAVISQNTVITSDGAITVTSSQGAIQLTSPSAIQVRRAATAKKPASTVQIIIPAERAALNAEQGLTNGNGKLTLGKQYEVLNPKTGKWGKVPKITTNGDHEFAIRLKPTAKLVKNVLTGDAKSFAGTLTVTRGTFTNSKNKQQTGITNAVITRGVVVLD